MSRFFGSVRWLAGVAAFWLAYPLGFSRSAWHTRLAMRLDFSPFRLW